MADDKFGTDDTSVVWVHRAPRGPQPTGVPIYFVKQANILYRRSDGDRFMMLPDQQLTEDGWAPVVGQLTHSFDAFPFPAPSRRGGPDGAPDPALFDTLTEIDEAEARDIARGLGLPAEGW